MTIEFPNLHPIINAVGYATRVTGSCPHPDVITAMSVASSQYFELDDLLSAASSLIQQCTSAEAGIVTSGASAALTLAAAACLAGNSTQIMDQLPDVSGCPRHEIIYPLPGPFDYDHAIRLSGAKLVLIDYHAEDALRRIEQAIGPRTAAIGFVTALASLAHHYGLPLIVDAACALPPMENLQMFTRCGADLTAYSGGKHLGGPQASGILCGRDELIRSAWLQMVDMDVREGTWSLQHWISQGWLSHPPRHGIGRSMKVSKESIVGVMAALQRYSARSPDVEYTQWHATIEQIHSGVADLSGLRFRRLPCGINGQRYPCLQIESESPPCGLHVRDLLLALRNRRRKIILAEDEKSPDRAFIYPQCLQTGDADEIADAIRSFVLSSPDPTAQTCLS
jgi:D-glucosaminate-6-phosphate ammonia-lyase